MHKTTIGNQRPMIQRVLAKTVLLASALLAVATVRAEEAGLAPAGTNVGNVASLQRGAKLYFNYCSGCHSIKYMSYSRLAQDLQLSEAQVLGSFAFTGAKIGDQVVSNMPEDKAQAFFNKVPPDLSLEARAKGPDWIYNYLKSFYLDPSRPVGWNNTVFPGASMPNVLWELQGLQRAHYAPAKGGEEPAVEKLELAEKGRLSAHEFDETARDVTAFLQYVGEPAALKREAMGVWVILYLAFFTLLAYMLKHEYWNDVHYTSVAAPEDPGRRTPPQRLRRLQTAKCITTTVLGYAPDCGGCTLTKRGAGMRHVAQGAVPFPRGPCKIFVAEGGSMHACYMTIPGIAQQC